MKKDNRSERAKAAFDRNQRELGQAALSAAAQQAHLETQRVANNLKRLRPMVTQTLDLLERHGFPDVIMVATKGGRNIFGGQRRPEMVPGWLVLQRSRYSAPEDFDSRYASHSTPASAYYLLADGRFVYGTDAPDDRRDLTVDDETVARDKDFETLLNNVSNLGNKLDRHALNEFLPSEE